MTLLVLITASIAGTVYINGTRVDVLPVATLEGVTVRFDDQGNVWIDAPRYQVAEIPAGKSGAPPAGASGVAPGNWWLVTADEGSTGHAVDVVINGIVVQRVQSGQSQVVLDLGPWLKPGANKVQMQAQAGPVPTGGTFSVFVGTGSNQGGTLKIDHAAVRYTRTVSDSPTGGSRDYTVTVP